MNKYKYQTKSKSDLIELLLDGERVNLVGGSAEKTLPSTKRRAAQRVVIRGITDQDVEKLLSNPGKYGDWSDKFIDVGSGYPPKFTIKASTVKKSPVAAVEPEPEKPEVEKEPEPVIEPELKEKPKKKPSKAKKEDTDK